MNGTALNSAVMKCSQFVSLACDLDSLGWFDETQDERPSNHRIETLRRHMDDTVESFVALERVAVELQRAYNDIPNAGNAD